MTPSFDEFCLANSVKHPLEKNHLSNLPHLILRHTTGHCGTFLNQVEIILDVVGTIFPLDWNIITLLYPTKISG